MYEPIYDSILFKDMGRKDAEQIVSRLNGSIRSYKKGEIIIGEEEILRKIGILVQGTLCKVQVYDNGTEQVVQKLKESYMVGLEIALSQKKNSPYCIYALEDACIYWFSVSCLEQEGVLSAQERIYLYQQAVGFLASEDIRKYKKIEILSEKSARGRIEKYLKYQMKRFHSTEFDIEFDREQLASYLGLNRSVLSHELKKMEKEGILKVRKNHFQYLDGMRR